MRQDPGTCCNCRASRRQMRIRTSIVGVQRDGAFVVVPETNVWVHDFTITPELGAVFDPFGYA